MYSEHIQVVQKSTDDKETQMDKISMWKDAVEQHCITAYRRWGDLSQRQVALLLVIANNQDTVEY